MASNTYLCCGFFVGVFFPCLSFLSCVPNVGDDALTRNLPRKKTECYYKTTHPFFLKINYDNFRISDEYRYNLSVKLRVWT